MPAPRILTAYNKAIKDIGVVENYRNKSKTLQPQFQGFIAEIIMLRLFSILEKAVIDISCRVACGAQYVNGIVPSPTIVARSLDDAINLFKTFNRTQALNYLKFTNVRSTNDAIKMVIPATEPFRYNLSSYSNQFEEMRKVRNQIAHRTSDTYNKYKSVIVCRYGSMLKIKTSVFLTSTSRERIPVLDQYITTVKLMINDMVKGC